MRPKLLFLKSKDPQEVQVDQTLPMGRIGNPESMDHPKAQSLCLVGWTSREEFNKVQRIHRGEKGSMAIATPKLGGKS